MLVPIVLLVCFVGGLGYAYSKNFFGEAYLSPLPITAAGQKGKQQNTQAQLETLLAERQLSPAKILQFDEFSYQVTFPSGETVLFSSKKDLTLQVSSLQLVRSRLTIEGKEFARLDLRFDKPVVIFK